MLNIVCCMSLQSVMNEMLQPNVNINILSDDRLYVIGLGYVQ